MNRISLLMVAFVATNCFTHAFVPSNSLQSVPSQRITAYSMQQQQRKQQQQSQQQRKKSISTTLQLQSDKDTDLTRTSPPTSSSTLLKEGTDLEETTTSSTPSAMKPNGLWDNQENPGIYKTAIRRTLYWVAAAIGYGFLLIFVAGPETSGEFYAGYLLEQSLSIDNLLVFLLLFEYFKVPLEFQNRVLNWGIIGSIVMRATMIGIGSVALKEVHEVLLVFAAILLYSSFQVITGDDDDEEEDLSENAIVKFANNLFSSTDKFDGDRFFTEIDGIKMATPMLLCMIAVEISDVVFAVDSIPAIFGVTEVRYRSKHHQNETTHCIALHDID
jgi:predicted tellurium resistance membrane protein TerC